MATHNDLGKIGEDKAVEFLQNLGYEILCRNWRFKKLELDIVCLYKGILIFVEVKTRSSVEFGLPQDFVKQTKIKKLLSAANAYIEENNRDEEVRFDIIAIHNISQKYIIEHIEDAFYFF
ncbi:YraN family protein [Myroides injenensis]|uniref:YraN family protein n=1 Tax=Myroides injenensis TaxID=1183151 RepID=UPI0002887960|nr:YraN family protein [Myroides injenensis]